MSPTSRLIAAALFTVVSLTAACPPALACGVDPEEVAVLDAVQAYVDHSFLPQERGVVTAFDGERGTATVRIAYASSTRGFLLDLLRVDDTWQVVGTRHEMPPEA